MFLINSVLLEHMIFFCLSTLRGYLCNHMNEQRYPGKVINSKYKSYCEAKGHSKCNFQGPKSISKIGFYIPFDCRIFLGQVLRLSLVRSKIQRHLCQMFHY